MTLQNAPPAPDMLWRGLSELERTAPELSEATLARGRGRLVMSAPGEPRELSHISHSINAEPASLPREVQRVGLLRRTPRRGG